METILYPSGQQATKEDCCEGCPYHYELTDDQKKTYDGHCGCESIESTGRCWKADHDEYEY